MGRWINGLVEGSINELLSDWLREEWIWMNEWMNEWVIEWMNMNECELMWMNGWTNE